VAKLKQAASGEPFATETISVGPKDQFERTYPMRQNDAVLVVLKKV